MVTKNAPWDIRAGLAATVFNGEIYLTGGSFQTTPFSPRKFYNDVWKTSDGKNWAQVAESTPFDKCSGPRLVVMGDYMYIIGGENGFSEETQFDLVFRTKDGIEWEDMGKPQWAKRSGHGVVVYNNIMYVIAGYYDLHDVWSSSDAKNWK